MKVIFFRFIFNVCIICSISSLPKIREFCSSNKVLMYLFNYIFLIGHESFFLLINKLSNKIFRKRRHI